MSADDGGSASEGSSARADGSAPSASPSHSADASGDESLWGRFRTADDGPLMVVREVLVSAGTVAVIGLLLFGISGVWPPMVAVESGSMQPHMQRGDLVFVTEPGRFAPDAAHGDTGVVTLEEGQATGYRTFSDYGSVLVYDSPRKDGPPVIHRAHFWVESGENWYDEANPAYIDAANCAQLNNCPAPHAGFITKGDNNGKYDQAYDPVAISSPVRPAWVEGVARVRIPYLGYVRLWLTGSAARPATVDVASVGLLDGGATTDVGVGVEVDTPGSVSTAPTAPSPSLAGVAAA